MSMSMRRAFPEILYLEITNRCNSKCATCVRTFDLAEPERDMGLEEVREIVSSFPPGHAPRRVVLHGVGEALLHADLIEIVRLFRSLGATVLFNSNALLLTPEITLALARVELSELRISIDGARPTTYRRLRGVDALDRVVQNTTLAVKALQSAGFERPKVSVWFTGTRSNIRELPEMVLLTHRMGVKELYFQRLVFREEREAFGAAKPGEALTRSPLEQAEEQAFAEAARVALALGVTIVGSGHAMNAREVVAHRQDDRPWAACTRPYRSTYVTANGNVLPCCVAPFSTSDYEAITLGGVRRATVQEIWMGERYERFRRRFESSSPVDCCRRCGADWSL